MRPLFPGRPRMVVLILLLVLGLKGTSWCQTQTATVRGYMSDDGSGQALRGANVLVRQVDRDTLRRGAATGPSGFYIVPELPLGRYELRVSYVGYETRVDTVHLEEPGIRQIDLALTPRDVELGEVRVRAREERTAGDLSAGVQSISSEELRLMPSLDVSGDLATYLTGTPGVTTIGDQGGEIYVRGGEPSQNLTLLDGIPVYKPFHLLGFYSAFSSSWVQSADIHSGGFGARYSGRISSAIDVRARSGNLQRFEAQAGISPFTSSVTVEGPVVPSHVSVLTSVRESFVEEVAERYVPGNLPFDFGDRFGKIHAQLGSRHRLSLFGLRTHDSGIVGEALVENGRGRVGWSNEAYGGRYRVLHGSEPMSGVLIAGYSRLSSGLGTEPSARESTLRTITTELHADWIGATHQFEWGIFLRQHQTTFNDDRRQVPALGVYLEPTVQVTDQLSVRPGATGLAVADVGTFLEPRLRMQYRWGGHLLSLAGGRYHQEMIGIQDRRDATGVFTAWTAPRSRTVPRAWHLLIGDQVDLSPRWDLSAELYYKDLRHLSLHEWSPFPELTTELEPASGRVAGLDLRLEMNRPHWYGYLGYGFSRVRYTFEGGIQKGVTFPPPHARRHQLNLLVQALWGGFAVSARWKFGSGRPFTKVAFDGFAPTTEPIDFFEHGGPRRVLFGRPYNSRLPAYHRLDVSISRQFRWNEVWIRTQASLINAYDRANLFAVDLFTRERADQLPVLPSLGLQISI